MWLGIWLGLAGISWGCDGNIGYGWIGWMGWLAGWIGCECGVMCMVYRMSYIHMLTDIRSLELGGVWIGRCLGRWVFGEGGVWRGRCLRRYLGRCVHMFPVCFIASGSFLLLALASCFLLLASCFLLLASCFLLLASCFLLFVYVFLLLLESLPSLLPSLPTPFSLQPPSLPSFPLPLPSLFLSSPGVWKQPRGNPTPIPQYPITPIHHNSQPRAANPAPPIKPIIHNPATYNPIPIPIPIAPTIRPELCS
ncbi:hypothetical protein BZA77DRAFT_55354 [Pyronema omphalodes]|nr:hypothetical protein BZA77DRAFT_55354 [Pyronema omphalodes]